MRPHHIDPMGPGVLNGPESLDSTARCAASKGGPLRVNAAEPMSQWEAERPIDILIVGPNSLGDES